MRTFDGSAVKARIAFPDLSETLVHGLLDKISGIRSSILNYRQPVGKFFVAGGFIMVGQHRDHGEHRPLSGYLLTVPPFNNQIMGEYRLAEKV